MLKSHYGGGGGYGAAVWRLPTSIYCFSCPISAMRPAKFCRIYSYMLWDLGLKVGHATRSVNECGAGASRYDGAHADARKPFLWGSAPLLRPIKSLSKQSHAWHGASIRDRQTGERDERHEKTGRSRYLVEPNLKEGKGGLRDLNTLFWIARYSYQVEALDDLVGLGVLTAEDCGCFENAMIFSGMCAAICIF